MTDSAPADPSAADPVNAERAPADPVSAERAPVADSRRPAWLMTPWTTIVVVTIAVALPLIVAVATLSGRRWFPVLDLAMTEFRVRDVGGRHTPLIGLPGRIGTFPEQGSHPGPISFWLIAPGYRLFGSSAWAMEASTVMIQTAWIAVALWIGHRRARLAGVLVVAAVIAVLLRGYGLVVLIQPWNPYLPLIAWIVVVLAAWSVVCGDHMMLVPLVVAASFAAQTHIPYLLMAGGLGLFAIGVVLVRCWRSDDRRSFVRPLAWTGGLFAVLWLAPLVEQVRHDPGNIRQLIDHFTSPTEDVIGWRIGGEVLLRHLDFVDGYLRLFTGTNRFLQVSSQTDGRIWPGALLLAAWIASVVVAVRMRHRSLIALDTVIGVTLLLSLVSMARIFGIVWYYLTLWAWGTTTLLIVAIVWTLAHWCIGAWPRRTTLTVRRVAIGGSLALGGLVVVSMVIVAPSTDHPEERLGTTVGALLQPTIDALDAGVGAADGRDGRYVVQWNDAYFFGSQGFGFVNELERAGFDVGMYEPWHVPVTQQRVIPDGQATAEVVMVTGGFVDQWRADDRVVEVASFDPRTDAEREQFAALRAGLIADLDASGLDDLVPIVDTNLFGVRTDPRLSQRVRDDAARLLLLGQETAVFIGPPGVAT
jgi:hypothetical protein